MYHSLCVGGWVMNERRGTAAPDGSKAIAALQGNTLIIV